MGPTATAVRVVATWLFRPAARPHALCRRRRRRQARHVGHSAPLLCAAVAVATLQCGFARGQSGQEALRPWRLPDREGATALAVVVVVAVEEEDCQPVATLTPSWCHVRTCFCGCDALFAPAHAALTRRHPTMARRHLRHLQPCMRDSVVVRLHLCKKCQDVVDRRRCAPSVPPFKLRDRLPRGRDEFLHCSKCGSRLRVVWLCKNANAKHAARDAR